MTVAMTFSNKYLCCVTLMP